MILLLIAIALLTGAIVIALVLAQRQREARLAARIVRLRRGRHSAEVVWLHAAQPMSRVLPPAATASARRRRASSA